MEKTLETHEAVIADMREHANSNREAYKIDEEDIFSKEEADACDMFADRAEAAHKREVDALTAKLDEAVRLERSQRKTVYLVVETSHETGGEPDTRIAHVCATRLRAQELMEQDGAFIADMPESTLHENRYHGKNDEWEYDYCVMEMEVEE